MVGRPPLQGDKGEPKHTAQPEQVLALVAVGGPPYRKGGDQLREALESLRESELEDVIPGDFEEEDGEDVGCVDCDGERASEPWASDRVETPRMERVSSLSGACVRPRPRAQHPLTVVGQAVDAR